MGCCWLIFQAGEAGSFQRSVALTDQQQADSALRLMIFGRCALKPFKPLRVMMKACAFRQAQRLVCRNLSQQREVVLGRCALMLFEQAFQPVVPAAQGYRAAGQRVPQVVFDVQGMQLAVGQLPRQIETEAVIAGGAIDQRLVMSIASHLAQYAAAFTHCDLHMALWCIRVP